MTLAAIRLRVHDVLQASDLGYTPAVSPFDWAHQPTGEVDQVYRLEFEAGSTVGGFNFSEERTDLLRVWLARKLDADAEAVYQQLAEDANAIRSAVIHDGLEDGGDYGVPNDGSTATIQHAAGAEFAVLQVTIPINYELTV